MKDNKQQVRALCVGRHPYVSDHIARFFSSLGVETSRAVGLEDALRVSRLFEPQVVICEYEVLVSLSLDAWERDELLSKTPVIAVSLTRRPDEAHLLDVNSIGGFLYLPRLEPDAAMRIIVASTARPHYTPAPVTSSPVAETEAQV